MLRLQCLLSTASSEDEALSVHVLTIAASLDERIEDLEARIAAEVEATEIQARPNTVFNTTMKLYCVRHQRLTYRQDPTTKTEKLFLDGKPISGLDAFSLQSAQQLVPWALVSWYYKEKQFAFPDAVDIVAVWEDTVTSK
ncbi:hypothetical protein PF005_g23245 [Phytophthora fragariae]|uniref:Uncharacterized protein n=1 Tax=Phytophthora fragariae TaxID=53985 RepID=A0A6A3IE72_9STRA|nr:hypothetical protein PF003_g4275 [Phytophthora fragariae]KAE8925793.1 hypothetical protein PF009_g24007 [Phytophthora fragariae]KAE8981356.1 hypothetical protein PF011_g22053 [Phytophthora fragariae]KAE9079796.1 hypothetical protein PF007_g23306 [Phytophthora fragariae]KAE9080409.1 hypothetical protein PF010_g22397 [Phytophthora fragariae]